MESDFKDVQGLGEIVEDGAVEATNEEAPVDELIPEESFDGLEPGADLFITPEVVEEASSTEVIAKYRMLGETTRNDATGTLQHVPAGAVVEMPVSVGDAQVERGEAERVVE